ncbi:hypothetical protein BHE74_00003001 [Ensete ventricosum]|nr:hypothetical protein GW17_00039141 [Ensete ventricosum]RWW88133.1 hypothetical protein BHE74_00003001 [Ensete ventricosum]RZR77037.1 hypothetical protein BHM03_00002004 [Ensete ventricosum]
MNLRVNWCIINFTGACREFVGSSPRVIGELLGVRRELTKGDWELVGNAPGVRQKMTETHQELPECTGGSPEDDQDSSGVRRRLPGRLSGVGKVT